MLTYNLLIYFFISRLVLPYSGYRIPHRSEAAILLDSHLVGNSYTPGWSFGLVAQGVTPAVLGPGPDAMATAGRICSHIGDYGDDGSCGCCEGGAV